MDLNLILIIALAAGLPLAGALGYFLSRRRNAGEAAKARAEADKIIAAARRSAAGIEKEAELKGSQKLVEKERAFEEATRNRRQETTKLERAAKDKDAELNRRMQQSKRTEDELQARDEALARDEAGLKAEQAKLRDIIAEQTGKLEAVAGMSREQALAQLKSEIEVASRAELDRWVKRLEEQARDQGKKEAARILAQSVEQAAPRYAAESTTTVVKLPADDLKGRIIGREGRNIRSFESVTGVDLMIDDAPDTIILSSFNPLRREIAKQTLDKLVEDGRIHPARIEETYDKVRRDFDEQLLGFGKDAAFNLGIHDLKDRVLLLLGKLKFRHSDGQNILAHTLEMAEIAGHMGRILELNATALKRAGLYHELGLVEDATDTDAHPLQLAAELAKRSGESPLVVALIEGLRQGAPPNIAEAHLLRAAERLSYDRPGALRDGLEHHLERMQNLESLATGFTGVTRAYALKSGRELLVMLDNAKVSDQNALRLCEDLAVRIHQEMHLNGQVRIAVIRESRAIDYAT